MSKRKLIHGENPEEYFSEELKYLAERIKTCGFRDHRVNELEEILNEMNNYIKVNKKN